MKHNKTQFTQTIPITADHIDGLHHVNNVQYLYWVQEIAKAHWTSIIENTTVNGVWVVRQHQIMYKKPAFEGDVIKATTYIKSLRGPLSERVVTFQNSKNEDVLVQCTTQWCYIDPHTRAVLPTPKFLYAYLSPNN